MEKMKYFMENMKYFIEKMKYCDVDKMSTSWMKNKNKVPRTTTIFKLVGLCVILSHGQNPEACFARNVVKRDFLNDFETAVVR